MKFEVGVEPLPGTWLTQAIGRGGFAEVWEARKSNGAVVALKFLDCRHHPPAVVVREVRALITIKTVEHPHLIRLDAVTAIPGYIVLTMERADGNLNDLRDVYQESTGRNISPDHLLDLLDHAAEGLDFLASRAQEVFGRLGAWQHCDVKPGNLLLVGDSLKVADFGLCSSAWTQSARRGFMGTPPYAAPEQYEGRVTERSDQFALAVTWCELVAGARVFHPAGLFDPSRFSMPIDLSKLRENEYPVIARALDPRWTNRFPSCKAFVQALRNAATSTRPGRPKTLVGNQRG